MPKNTTPYFQPLDQGIIRSLKVAYRRKYVENLVQVFNSLHQTPLQIDILQAIHFIVEAWLELPPTVIFNCWKQAGIHPALQKGSSYWSSYADYVESLKTRTSISIHTLLDPDVQSLHSGQMATLIENYLFHKEEAMDSAICPSTVVSLNISEMIAEIQHSEVEDPDPELEPTVIIPPPTTTEAINHIQALQLYLESLCITVLPHPSLQNSVLEVPDLVSQCQIIQLALQRYQHSQRKQSTLTAWLQSPKNSSTGHSSQSATRVPVSGQTSGLVSESVSAPASENNSLPQSSLASLSLHDNSFQPLES